MKALKKILLRCVLGVLIVCLLAVVAINLILQSKGFHQRIQTEFRKRTGLPVHVAKISFFPVRGLVMKDVTIPNAEPVAAMVGLPLLKAERLQVKVALTSLLAGRLEIEEVVCSRPTLTGVQLPSGGLALPGSEKQPEDQRETPVVAGPRELTRKVGEIEPEKGRVDGSSPPGRGRADAEVPERPTGGVRRSAALSVVLKWLEVEDGTFQLLSPGGRVQLLECRGIRTRLAPDDKRFHSEGFLGRLHVAEVRMLKLLQGAGFEADLVFQNGVLQLPELTGTSDGGTILGQAALHPTRPGMPFQMAVRVADVGIDPVVKRAGLRLDFTRGTLEGEMKVSGFLQRLASLNGDGYVRAVDPVIASNSLLRPVGRYLNLREFVDLRFEESHCRFKIRGTELDLEDAYLKSDNFTFRACGYAYVAKPLNIAARLYFTERVKQILRRIERQLPEGMIRPFDQLEGVEGYYRDFRIGGPIDAPRANFLGRGRSLPEMVRDFGEVLNGDEGAAAPEPGPEGPADPDSLPPQPVKTNPGTEGIPDPGESERSTEATSSG
ncbi:MAG: AsmA family protein [Verrucomicrobiota bacterium]